MGFGSETEPAAPSKREIQQFQKAMRDDLARSGLIASHLKKLRYEILIPQDSLSEFGWPNWSYRIPYIDPVTGEDTGYHRYRFMEEVSNSKGKIIKYMQRSGTTPRLYFPPIYTPKKWATILNDPNQFIVFTEGEKKAARACVEGLPTIALGGVSSFSCKRLGQRLIDDFKLITLKGRRVEICFDSDFRTNEDVMRELRRFAKELYREGAIVLFRWLPDDYDKIGLDDFFAAGAQLTDYEQLPFDAYEQCKEVLELNNELAYIKNVNASYDIKTGTWYKTKPALVDMGYANRVIIDPETDREHNIAALWLKSKMRRTHKRLVYEPMPIYEPFEFPLITDNNELNLWRGWGAYPEPGNLDDFNRLLDYVFGDDPDQRDNFLKWAAYPIQYPGTKLTTSFMIQSPLQGSGKSSLGLILGDIYGCNFSNVDAGSLFESFNSWARNKQFVLGDEITADAFNKRRSSDKIKNMITRETISINEKYKPVYEVKDCINYLLTSNHPDALYLEEFDRRFYVHTIMAKAVPENLGKWVERFRFGNGQKGRAALMHYLLTEVDVSDFNPKGEAKDSFSKEMMREAGRSDLEQWAWQLANDPDEALRITGKTFDRDIYTTAQLLKIYDPLGKKNVTLHALGKALKKYQLFYKQIRLENGKREKLIPIRNRDKWMRHKSTKWAEHYEQSKVHDLDMRRTPINEKNGNKNKKKE